MSAAAFTLPGRPNFPNDLHVVLVDAAAEQSKILDKLQALHYTVDAFESASEAVAYFEQDSVVPDVVLAEADLVQRAEECAPDLLRRIHDSGVQLVLMNSCAKPDDVMLGIESGAADFLQKPVSTHRLRNIWQHVVRKVMATEGVEDKSSGAISTISKSAGSAQLAPCFGGAAETGTNCISGTAATSKVEELQAASVTGGAESEVQQQGHSGTTSHGSHSLDADASSSVIESAIGGRARYQRPRSDSAKATGRAVGSRTTRSRKAKAFGKVASLGSLAASGSPLVLLTDSSFQLPPPIMLPTVPWHQQVPDVWNSMPLGTHSVNVSKWQQGPVAFMPVGSTEGVGPTASPKRNRRGKSGASSLSSLPSTKTLGESSFLSIDSLGSSSVFELDPSLMDLGQLECNAELGGSSPCFGGSHDSLDSDFTDLIPDDIFSDSIFGDDAEVPGLWPDVALQADDAKCRPSGVRNFSTVAPQFPPIGLSLRKSQSLVNLINRHLAIEASTGVAAADAPASLQLP